MLCRVKKVLESIPFVVYLILVLSVATVIANLTGHTEAEIDSLLSAIDTNRDGALDAIDLTGTATNRLLLPQNDAAATPSFAFGDGDTGFQEASDDIMEWILVGTPTISMDSAGWYCIVNAPSWYLRTIAATATAPPYAFYGDANTGMGKAAADSATMIAGGKAVMGFTENTYVETQRYGDDATHGGYLDRVYSATSGTLTGASDTIPLAIPSGWLITACQLHVKTAVVDDGGDDTWDAELNDGAQEEAIGTAFAAAQNTNVNHRADEEVTGTLTDAETNIVLTPNGGSFTAGEIEAHCLCKGFDTWDNE